MERQACEFTKQTVKEKAVQGPLFPEHHLCVRHRMKIDTGMKLTNDCPPTVWWFEKKWTLKGGALLGGAASLEEV